MSSDPEHDVKACAEFQQKLAELFEKDEVYADPHLQSCDRCRALVVDLELIAEEARRFFGRRD